MSIQYGDLKFFTRLKIIKLFLIATFQKSFQRKIDNDDQMIFTGYFSKVISSI